MMARADAVGARKRLLNILRAWRALRSVVAAALRAGDDSLRSVIG